MSLPGGDDFGRRPIDMHLAGLEALGARFDRRHGYLEAAPTTGCGAPTSRSSSRASAPPRTSSWPPSLAKGTTVLDNAAREPEIVDLCRFLVGMGAQIEGVGSPVVTVHGVARGRPATARATASWPIGSRRPPTSPRSAVAGGEITVRDARAEHMEVVLAQARARWA